MELSDLKYSVAIRTLGNAGVKFQKELNSLLQQTIKPERILIYLAEGYSKPKETIGIEEFVFVKKGMVAQRALPYTEIDSEYILLLDDDVELQSDSVEKLLKVAGQEGADVVGADTFKNQDMSLIAKVFALLTNWVHPHFDKKWAFKMHSHGGFSYLNRPKKDYYPSQSCAGPASLWRKETLLKLHLDDELFLDELGFAFDDDTLEFYKVHKNNYKLFIHYQSGIEHLDAKSSSGGYQKNINKYYTRSKASFILWWRMFYESSNFKLMTSVAYVSKAIWLFLINLLASIRFVNLSIIILYLKGIHDGWKYVHSDRYRAIPSFVIK